MDETGIIKDIKGIYATVLITPQDKTYCDGCKGGGICQPTNEHERLIEAVNQVGAQIGNKVTISFKSLSYLSGIVVVYGIPCIMLLIGAIIGKEILSPMMPTIDGEALSAGMGFVFFMSSFLVIKILSSFSKRQSKPVITAVID